MYTNFLFAGFGRLRAARLQRALRGPGRFILLVFFIFLSCKAYGVIFKICIEVYINLVL
jgi:hypothetical protein